MSVQFLASFYRLIYRKTQITYKYPRNLWEIFTRTCAFENISMFKNGNMFESARTFKIPNINVMFIFSTTSANNNQILKMYAYVVILRHASTLRMINIQQIIYIKI